MARFVDSPGLPTWAGDLYDGCLSHTYSSFQEKGGHVNNRAAGVILLVASAGFCTIGMAASQIANAINQGAFHASHTSGFVPPGPTEACLGWPSAIAVTVLAVLGAVFLFKRD